MIILSSITIAPMGKARPRVTRRGTYMPKKYTEWKRSAVALLNAQLPTCELPLTGILALDVTFATCTGNCRSDIDNAYAALADALQDARWIENDRQIKAGSFELRKGKRDEISFTITTGNRT